MGAFKNTLVIDGFNFQRGFGGFQDSQRRRHDFRPDAVTIGDSDRDTSGHFPDLSSDYLSTDYTDYTESV
jgi:hypothetical protein